MAPVKVFITPAEVAERKQTEDTTKKDLGARRDAAREERRALEAQFKEPARQGARDLALLRR